MLIKMRMTLLFFFSNCWNDQLVHIKSVNSLRSSNLTVKGSKFVWNARELEYLCVVVRGGQFRVLEARVLAIAKFQRPRTVELVISGFDVI